MCNYEVLNPHSRLLKKKKEINFTSDSNVNDKLSQMFCHTDYRIIYMNGTKEYLGLYGCLFWEA